MLFEKQKSKSENSNPVHDKIAVRIAGYLIKAQTKFAQFMNKNSSAVSTKRMKAFLVIFCLISGSFSLYFVGKGLFNRENETTIILDKVHTPKYYDKVGDDMISSETYIDEETWSKVQLFRNYMDSLKTNGSNSYDSMVKARPGLMDSVRAIEDIYYSQKIK
jgi:hypothetical protein